jgi:spore germination protein KA
MAGKQKSVYVCAECGAEYPRWAGKCAACGAWNTIAEEVRTAARPSGSAHRATPTPMDAIDTQSETRYRTGMNELDRVLGGGIVPGGLMLIGGDPGIGKSTLLLQICGQLERKMKVLYVSGEESARQIKLRAERLGVLGGNLLLLCETDVDSILETVRAEKPDILVAKILEGRVAILVDGSPIALTVPYLLLEDFQSPSDYYNSPYSATTARIIRLFSVILALLLPALFVSAELFHLQLIPLSFLLTIVNSIKGIPLSPSYEMFFTLLIFEILNEASVRMPKYVGMVVSIVGGLVLGETAVTAGIISAPTLMIIALSGICLYTVPELEQTFSVLRIFFLIVAGSGGIYGLLVAVALLFIYLISFENYNTPICAPFSPLIIKDMKDAVYKGFICEMDYRPQSIKNSNKKRINSNYCNKD